MKNTTYCVLNMWTTTLTIPLVVDLKSWLHDMVKFLLVSTHCYRFFAVHVTVCSKGIQDRLYPLHPTDFYRLKNKIFVDI